MQFFFEIVPGKPPIPLLPVDVNGKARVADGEKLFNLDDAAKRSGLSKQYLSDLWTGTWSEFVTPDASPLASDADKADSSAAGLSEKIEQTRHLALRQMLFPHLDDQQFAAFKEMCSVRGVNPFARQAYARIEDDKRLGAKVVVMIMGIEGMRLIAHRTDLLAGIDESTFKFDSDDRIESATTTVYRISNGVRQPYTSTAHREEYLPISDEEFANQMPRVWLSRCSEIAALRKAFPQELGGIYTPDEFKRLDSIYQRRTEAALADSQVERELLPPRMTAFSPPDAPRTYDQFLGELESIGISDEADRVKLIRHFRDRKLALAESNPPAFWKYMLEQVRQDPEKWGAKIEVAA